MSRSYRKTPKGKSYYSSSARCSDKYWKQTYNRKVRRGTTTLLASLNVDDMDDVTYPTVRSHSDVWDSQQDGPKRYFGDLNSERIQYDAVYTSNYSKTTSIYITKATLDDFYMVTFPDTVMKSILHNINDGYGYWHSWPVWELMWTYEKKVSVRKNSFKKMMRK